MAPKNHSPRALDVAALAREGTRVQGRWSAAEMPRLLAGTLPLEAWQAPAEVTWAAQGLLRDQAGGKPKVWMRLQAQCDAALTCQRCLQPVQERLLLQREILFVATEAEAAALDEKLEEDVLVLQRALDLRELVEDELILALPLVPMHASCQLPRTQESAPEPEPEAQAHPFAALARLKRPD